MRLKAVVVGVLDAASPPGKGEYVSFLLEKVARVASSRGYESEGELNDGLGWMSASSGVIAAAEGGNSSVRGDLNPHPAARVKVELAALLARRVLSCSVDTSHRDNRRRWNYLLNVRDGCGMG